MTLWLSTCFTLSCRQRRAFAISDCCITRETVQLLVFGISTIPTESATTQILCPHRRGLQKFREMTIGCSNHFLSVWQDKFQNLEFYTLLFLVTFYLLGPTYVIHFGPTWRHSSIWQQAEWKLKAHMVQRQIPAFCHLLNIGLYVYCNAKKQGSDILQTFNLRRRNHKEIICIMNRHTVEVKAIISKMCSLCAAIR